MPRSMKQLNFLHALQSDQKNPSQIKPLGMGLNKPVSSQIQNPMINQRPIPVTHIPQPMGPKIMPSQNSVSVPSLPSLNKMPRFGKMRNSLKGQFKSK